MMLRLLSILCNLMIFCSTLAIIIGFCCREGRWDREKCRTIFRYFTCQSNVLCAIAAGLMAVSQLFGTTPWIIWMLKYMGTVSVTVTLMTVLLFLGPTMGGYKELMAGANLYLHLIGPILAIISFCFCEKGNMDIPTALWGLVPVMAYGLLYLYKVIYAPPEKRWEDFYGFNRGGKWPISYAAMITATVIICMVLRVL